MWLPGGAGVSPYWQSAWSEACCKLTPPPDPREATRRGVLGDESRPLSGARTPFLRLHLCLKTKFIRIMIFMVHPRPLLKVPTSLRGMQGFEPTLHARPHSSPPRSSSHGHPHVDKWPHSAGAMRLSALPWGQKHPWCRRILAIGMGLARWTTHLPAHLSPGP